MWWPRDPKLYDLSIETMVDACFGMRKVEVVSGKVLLNNHVRYQRLALDQGYWPDGLLAVPSDDALHRDVELTRPMGYNGARKHQKLEDPCAPYRVDKLGRLVWGELPDACWLGEREQRRLMRDLSGAIRRDNNHPSLITWVPLNESRGVPFICHTAHSLEGIRIVSGNDGWEQPSTDLVGIHDYTAWPKQLSLECQSAEQTLCGNPGDDRIVSAGTMTTQASRC